MDSSLVLDGEGNPHISYKYYRINYDDDLKYAYQDASGWHIQTVDSAGKVGKYTSLALDGSEYPHISYYDIANEDLKYAYLDASGWHTQTVDSEGSVGKYTSLVLDGNGYPHISYYDNTNEDLKYAYSALLAVTKQVEGTLYDAGGTIVGCESTFVSSTHLDPDQTSSFELNYSGRDYADVTSYRLQVEGNPQ